ncbi:hypothetical protein QAD02_002521 [Eretmocerus hayati]|uniref:Uncharacterized protein n=1 Tax=Eretmocerus hayati TaxID=131215 RepID=A0ACC2NM12_9HYME|nr:hypothetical protein QAD02_002521 [Eretmocerus hayati]
MHVQLLCILLLLSYHHTTQTRTNQRTETKQSTETSTVANQSDIRSHSPWEVTDRDDGPKEDIDCTTNGPRPLESPPNRVDTGLGVRDRRRTEPSTSANQSDICSHSPWEVTDRDDGPKEDIDCTTNGPQTLESPPICVDTGSSRCVPVASNPPWATTVTCGSRAGMVSDRRRTESRGSPATSGGFDSSWGREN